MPFVKGGGGVHGEGGFDVVRNEVSMRGEFKAYRNWYIDSDAWLEILKKKRDYPWVVAPEELERWHLKRGR